MAEKKYIELDAARNAVLGFERYTGIAELPVEFAEAEIDKLPAADVQPVRHGRWELDSDPGEPWRYVCNKCGEKTRDTVMGKPRANFCPNCGARMDGGEGNGKD